MKKLFKQILKFVLVGGSAFIIDTIIYSILIHFNCNYLIAQIISFAISLTYNYFLSIKWVFDAKKQTVKEIMIFIVLSVIGLGINELLLYIGVDVLKYNSKMEQIIVKVFATGIVTVYNFITRKLFVEKKDKSTSQ